MGRIHILDKSVSNMIAAGEVVARPASAVKELLENSMDAGAKNITVEIKNGGITLIRVTDDGTGIEEDDILTAFMPHATSKISRESDLEGIMTYGFRGEALSSIAAVSKIVLTTKTKEQDTAARIYLEGGTVTGSETVGAKNGTSIVVNDIFYNTPARYKFLKKDSAEAAAVTDVCQKAALSHPDISLCYISAGREVFKTQGDGSLINAVYSVFGADFAKHMLPVSYNEGGAEISGFIGTAAAARPNRNMQIFFVNGRSVSSKIMSFALSEAYKNQLTVGRFPSAVINLKITPSSVDVNVHPSKTEVKFTDEKAIYNAVYWGCKNTLYEKPYVPEVEKISENKIEKAYVSNFEKEGPAVKEENSPSVEVNASLTNGKSTGGFKLIEPQKKNTELYMAEEKVKYVLGGNEQRLEPQNIDVTARKAAYETVQEAIEMPDADEFKLVGQIFETYIIVQKGTDMLMIDQHAAHERLNFEALKKKRETNEPAGQLFLVPEIFSLGNEETVIWEENKDFLLSIGFETDKMGERDIMVRSAPAGTDVSECKNVILEILTILADKKHDTRTYLEERAMYSVSCKAAIKANMAISEMEQEELVKKVMALDGINTCPHGRPICIKITKEKIEKEFKRT